MVSPSRQHYDKKYAPAALSSMKSTESKRDDAKRIAALEAHVRQTLASFSSSHEANSSNRLALPAATAITQFIASVECAFHSDALIDTSAFHRCLYALGISPDDSALLLDRFDAKHTGFIDAAVLVQRLLSNTTNSTGNSKLATSTNTSSTETDAAEAAEAAAEARAMKQLHRKVIERVLVKSKTQNIKDAFRQYDSDKRGFLTLAQFRAMARDHGGCVGTDVERLLRYLDRDRQGSISFHAFAGNAKLGANQAYPKAASPSPKKQRQLAQPLSKPQGASSPTRTKTTTTGGASSASSHQDVTTAVDPLDDIRSKLRQRVMGHNKSIREVFTDFDADSSGSLDYDEFKQFMTRYNFSQADACHAIAFLDRDFSGTIDYDEFAAGLLFFRPPPPPPSVTATTASVVATTTKATLSHNGSATHIAATSSPSHRYSSDKDESTHTATTTLSPAKVAHLLQTVQQKLAEKLFARSTSDQRDYKTRQSATRAHKRRLRATFLQFDADEKSGLDYQEFSAFLVRFGIKLNAYELSALVALVDTNGSEVIAFDALFELVDRRHSGNDVDLNLYMNDDSAGSDSDSDGHAAGTGSDDSSDHGASDGDDDDDKCEDTYDAFDNADGHRVDGTGAFNAKRRAQDATSNAPVTNKRNDNNQQQQLRAVFSQYDCDQSGFLDYDEFAQLMQDFGFRAAPHATQRVRNDNDRGSNAVRPNKQSSTHIERARGRVNYHDIAYAVRQQKHRNSVDRTSSSPPPPKRHATAATNTATSSTTGSTTAPGSNAQARWVTRVLQKHRSLEDAFRYHDIDSSGALDYDAFCRFVKHYGDMTDESDITTWIDTLDVDGTGAIQLDAFLHMFARSDQRAKPLKITPAQQLTREDASAQLLVRLQDIKVRWIELALQDFDSVRDAFRAFDIDGSNELTFAQFEALMKRYGLTDNDDVALLIDRMDVDRSGAIDLHEFLTLFHDERVTLREQQQQQPHQQRHGATSNATEKRLKPTPANKAALERRERSAQRRQHEDAWIERAIDAHGSVRAAFDAFDRDRSGALDYVEFERLLRAFGFARRDDVETLRKRLDVDRSGAIDFDEFATVFYDTRVDASARNGRDDVPAPSQRVSAASMHAPTQARSTIEDKRARAARQRALELKWMTRVLSCHATIDAAFSEYDVDHSGELDHDEFARFMKRYGIGRDDDIATLIRRLDADASGTIDSGEFATVFNPLRLGRGRCHVHSMLAGTNHTSSSTDDEPLDPDELTSVLEIERELASRMLETTRDLRSAFRRFDVNGNGRLEYKEFRRVLRTYRFPELEIRRVIRHLDRDVSGFIDYKEFIASFSAAAARDSDQREIVGRGGGRTSAVGGACSNGKKSPQR